MTINKAQGQTLEKIGVHLPEQVFGHEQFYDIKIKITQGREQGTLILNSDRFYTKNVVYKEVL